MKSTWKKAAAAAFISLVLGFFCGMGVHYFIPAGKWNPIGPRAAPDCKGDGDAFNRKIPVAAQGFCPEFFSGSPSILRLSERADTPLEEIGQKIRGNLGKSPLTLAIEVKTPPGRLRVIPLDLPMAREESGNGPCASWKVIELPWIPPAEPTEDPLTFPLCSGAEMFSHEEADCLRFAIASHPASEARSGGGCRSPSRVFLLGIEPAGGRKIRVGLGGAGETAEAAGPAGIRRIIWNNFTLSRRTSEAFVLVLDPNDKSTLQDLVDLVQEVLLSRIPPADRLWIKGWETSG
jgi:hypothetical protein